MTRREGGFAMLAAIAGAAAFAYIGLEAVASNRGEIAAATGEARRARLEAAADGGLMLAVQGLAADNPEVRWRIDGTAYSADIDGVALDIRVVDEHGKIPINRLDQDLARSLFEAGGARGDQLDQLVAAFLDWRDADDSRRPGGAEAPDYAPEGLRPRNGPFRTVDELSQIKGMDPALFARIRPYLTVFFGPNGGFDYTTAQPFALEVFSGGPAGAGGDRPAIAAPQDIDLTDRPMTVTVDADDGDGGRFRRTAIVELTDSPAHPYFIRYGE